MAVLYGETHVGNEEAIMNKTIGWVALAVSAGAIAYTIWLHASIDRRVAVAAEEAVRLREQQIVARLSTTLDKIYHDFGMKTPSDPMIIDDLLEPFVRLLEKRSH
jgi:hypothetical protein